MTREQQRHLRERAERISRELGSFSQDLRELGLDGWADVVARHRDDLNRTARRQLDATERARPELGPSRSWCGTCREGSGG